MIKLGVVDSRIELVSHQPEATLVDLVAEVERFRLVTELKTKYCYGCGLCCYDTIPVLGLDLADLKHQATGRGADLGDYVVMPEKPDLEDRRRSINDLVRQHELTSAQATLIYEHNTSEPLTLAKADTGACRFLSGNLCSIYPHRPFACRLYICNMGDQLESLYETIVRQGVWHSYHVLGWLPAEEIGHNPFLGVLSYQEVKLADFAFDLEGALEKLFFYF